MPKESRTLLHRPSILSRFACEIGSAEQITSSTEPREKKLVSVLIGKVGKVERVAGHSHPHAGPDFVDELELKRGRGRRARARHEHRQPAFLRRARHHLTCRMDAERKRAVHPLRSFDASAMEDAAEAQHCSREIAMAARVEQRPSGRASGAPILGDAVAI